MVIFTKNAKTIEEVNAIFDNSCGRVWHDMKVIIENNIFNTYEDWVKWALNTCMEAIPSPFSIDYPAGYNLNLSPNFFTLKIPNRFGVGIRVDTRKGNISYEVSIIFFNEAKLLENTEEYKAMIKNGWKVKDLKKK